LARAIAYTYAALKTAKVPNAARPRAESLAMTAVDAVRARLSDPTYTPRCEREPAKRRDATRASAAQGNSLLGSARCRNFPDRLSRARARALPGSRGGFQHRGNLSRKCKGRPELDRNVPRREDPRVPGIHLRCAPRQSSQSESIILAGSEIAVLPERRGLGRRSVLRHATTQDADERRFRSRIFHQAATMSSGRATPRARAARCVRARVPSRAHSRCLRIEIDRSPPRSRSRSRLSPIAIAIATRADHPSLPAPRTHRVVSCRVVAA
jgi:hypothetical protein